MKVERRYFTKEKNGVVFSTRRQVKKALRKKYGAATGRKWKKLMRIPSFKLLFANTVAKFNYDLQHNRSTGSL